MKKLSKLLLSLVLFFMSSILFSGCSCSGGYLIKVDFIEVPEGVSVESYEERVKFQSSHTVEFELPEGFEEDYVKVKVNDEDIEFNVEYLDAEEVEEDYFYSVKKKISFTVEGVKQDIDIDIDMTTLEKKIFDISFATGDVSDFEVVVINPESVDRLMVLNSTNTVRKVGFVGRKAQVSYGDYVAIVYNQPQTSSSISYSRLYTNTGYFSDTSKIKNMNGVNYLEYSVAMRGNSYYRYGGNNSSKIFYYGQVKESVEFLFTPPNDVRSNKLHIRDDYNTFYLLTNMQKYNSDLMTIETFIEDPNAMYSVNDKNVDRVEGKLLSKIEPKDSYNEKFDVHKFYIGDNIDNDYFLQEEDKADLNDTIYFKIKSEIGINNVDVRLLVNESVFGSGYVKLSKYLVSDKNNYYYKITKENLLDFYDKYTYTSSSGIEYDYYNGAAFLYAGVSLAYRNYEEYHGTFKYTMISLKTEKSESSSAGSLGTVKMIPYIDSGNGEKDYGYIDYHSHSNLDLFFIKTDKIFDENNKYKNNICIDVFGETYKSYSSTRLSSIDIVYGFNNTVASQKVGDATIYNGYKGFIITDEEELYFKPDANGQHSLCAVVNFVDIEKNNYKIDFSNLELTDNIREGIYVTNNYNVKNLVDFTFINNLSKVVDNNIDFGYERELYYIISSNYLKSLELNIYSDETKQKLISYEGVLYDITGKEVKINVNGEDFVVRYKYMAISYERPEKDAYRIYNY